MRLGRSLTRLPRFSFAKETSLAFLEILLVGSAGIRRFHRLHHRSETKSTLGSDLYSRFCGRIVSSLIRLFLRCGRKYRVRSQPDRSLYRERCSDRTLHLDWGDRDCIFPSAFTRAGEGKRLAEYPHPPKQNPSIAGKWPMMVVPV